MKRFIKIIILLLISININTIVRADPVSSVVSGAVTAKVASDLITEAKQSASTLIKEAEASGNALLILAANELNVLAQNATSLLGDQINMTVDKLSVEKRSLLIALNQLTEQVGQLHRDAYDLKDAMVLDLRAIMANFPIIGEKFYIQRVSGVTHLIKESSPYQLSISGTGLGIPSETIRSTVSLRLKDKEIEIKVHRTDAHTAKIEIPNEALNPFFLEKTMAKVETTLNVFHEIYSGWWIFKKWKGENHSIPIQLALMPSYAGTVEIEATVPNFDWVRVDTANNSRTTGNHHCSKNCRGEPTRTGYSITIKVAGNSTPKVGDRKLANPRLNCISGPCGGWNHVNGVWLSESNTRATGSFDVWTKPTTWRLTVDVYEWKLVNETKIKNTYDLKYGDIVEFAVPVTTTLAIIKGKKLTGAPINLVAGNNDPDNLLALEREIAPSGTSMYRKYLYRIRRPDGL